MRKLLILSVLALSISISAFATGMQFPSTNLTFSSVTASSITLNWTAGGGNTRIVIARKGSLPDITLSVPQYNTSYNANSNFTLGESLASGKVVYYGSGSTVTVTGLEASSAYYFTIIEVETTDNILYYANNEVATWKTDGNTTTTSGEAEQDDSDEDGVTDEEDEYPQDPQRAFNAGFPAANYGTLMFEDLWPGKGDYDFNDLVLNYKYNVVSNAAGNIVEVKYTFVTRAMGGALHNGFAFQLDGIPSNRIASVSGTKTTGIDYATISANGTEANQTNANIIVFKDAFDLLPFSGGGFINTEMDAPNVGTDTTEVIVTFTDLEGVSTPAANFNHSIFNPYIIVEKNRGHEIHLPNRVPSSLMNASLFGKDEDRSSPSQGIYYKTDTGLPWALDIVESIPYATEKTDFLEAFLKFGSWAASNGTMYTDWYLDMPEYRDNTKIYSK